VTSSWIFPSEKIVDLVEIWKNPTIESEIFLILGNLDNPKFLEIFTLLPLFNDRKKNFIGR
jgi:hypothetical protein